MHKNIMNTREIPHFDWGYFPVSADMLGGLTAGRDDSHMLLS
jgi:hypothetical protein